MRFYLSLLILFTSGVLEARTFKVLQYNAENFFDTKFDNGTHDYTYLPQSVKQSLPDHREACDAMSGFYREQCLHLDWNESKFTKKIINISRVIKSYDQSGKGPDIVVFQEVENVNVLNKLVTKGLKGMGYHHQVLIEGDDSRGIDVGLISKYPVISSRHHSVFVNGERLDTRGILEVTLNVEGKDVVVFCNHWPSQGNPSTERVASAKLLSRIASEKDADLIIAVGDFNTISGESPYPYHYLEGFIDTEKEARKINRDLNPGTHFYRGEWSSLDKIFVFEGTGMKADYSAFDILTPVFMMKEDDQTGEMVPVRFNHETGEGFSDHLPVKMKFTY